MLLVKHWVVLHAYGKQLQADAASQFFCRLMRLGIGINGFADQCADGTTLFPRHNCQSVLLGDGQVNSTTFPVEVESCMPPLRCVQSMYVKLVC